MHEMRESGVGYLGEIPVHWDTERIKNHLRFSPDKNPGDAMILSLYREHGIVPKDSRDDNHNVTSEDTSNYRYVRVGDFVVNKMKAWQGSMGVSDYEGAVSPAYYVYRFKTDAFDKKYLHYLLRSKCYADEFRRLSGGIRIGQWDLPKVGFETTYVAVPPKAEQTAIAEAIYVQLNKVDTLITNVQTQIEKLKAYKQSLITEVVTKGLDPTVPMKDSGVEWIGEIPEHWQIIRFRFIAKITTGNQDTQNAEPDGAYPFYVRSPIVERCNAYTFDGEGILMAGDGAGAGRVFHLADGKYAVHQRVYRFYDFKYMDPVLLKLYLENLFSTVMDYGSAKTTVPSVRLPMIQDFFVCVPPENEQQDMITVLSEKVDKIEKLIAIKQSKIEKLEQYKRSLIYEYVTGKKEVP